MKRGKKGPKKVKIMGRMERERKKVYIKKKKRDRVRGWRRERVRQR